MTYPGRSERPRWHAELVRLETELRHVTIALAWAERAGTPRRAAALWRGAARVRRRIAHLGDLLGLCPTPAKKPECHVSSLPARGVVARRRVGV